MRRKSSRLKRAGMPSKVKVSRASASATRKVTLSPKKSLKHRVALSNAARVGGVIPINLKVGRGFGKSDKVIVTAECCGPYQQPCPEFLCPA